MQKIISLKSLFIGATLTLALMFGFVAPALASTEYDEIEIEYSIVNGKTIVEVEYEIDDDEVEKNYTFPTTDLDEVWEDLAEELNLTVEEIEAISEEDDDDDDNGNSSSFEAEADVFTDTTIVEVEINDRKTIFEVDADTREEVIDEIVDRFDVSRSEVEAVLDFEVEDRASRPDDFDDDDSSDSEDDWSPSRDRDRDRDGWDDEFKDFGKSTDREELEEQLRILLTLLIQLLQEQL